MLAAPADRAMALCVAAPPVLRWVAGVLSSVRSTPTMRLSSPERSGWPFEATWASDVRDLEVQHVAVTYSGDGRVHRVLVLLLLLRLLLTCPGGVSATFPC